MVADGLSEQERGYVRSRDPSGSLLQDVMKVLAKFDHEKGAAPDVVKELFRPNPYWAVVAPALRYDLPSELEEFFTLRSKRFELQVFSGVHETDKGDYVSIVFIAVPIMGWEVARVKEEVLPKDQWPDWAKEWADDDLGTYQMDLEEWEELEARAIVPVLAKVIDDPVDDKGSYNKRRDAMVQVTKAICGAMPFKLYYSSSGNIPREITDAEIDPAILEDYNRKLASVGERLTKSPNEIYVLYENAGLLLSRDRFEEAKVLLDKALELEPNLPYPWFALSELYSRIGKDSEADKAEERAMELQRLLEGKRPGKADIYDFTPPFKRLPEGWDDSDEGDECRAMCCEDCGFDFVHITDGFWYTCNMCGHSGAIEGKGLVLSISAEKEEFKVGEPILVTAVIENRTDLEMTYSTDDLEFISTAPTEEVDDYGEDESTAEDVMDWFGKLKKPFANGVIPPHGRETLKIDLRKIETVTPTGEDEDDEEAVEGMFDIPSEHRVSLFLKVTVGPIEDKREPYVETEPIRIAILDK